MQYSFTNYMAPQLSFIFLNSTLSFKIVYIFILAKITNNTSISHTQSPGPVWISLSIGRSTCETICESLEKQLMTYP
jgi:hypothetical protein